jgi:glycosyltransferase involved in cell wall biosynthesis
MDPTAINRARSPAKLLALLSHCKPIVVEAVGEAPALVGQAGLLVAAGRELDFAAAAGRLIRDGELRARLSETAARRAAVECWPQRAEAVERAYYLYT